MKNILLILSLLLVEFAVLSQQTNTLPILIIVYEYTSPTDSILHSKSERSYDLNGNLTLQVDSDWDKNLNGWIRSYKYENTYNSSGTRTLDANYYWNSISNDWVGIYKQEFIYDFNGNRTLYVKYSWDSNSNDWIGTVKYEYICDSNGNRTLVLINNWDSDINEFILFQKRFYYYDGNNPFVERDALNNKISIYPNPVKDILYISTTVDYFEIEVIDLMGKKLLTSNHQPLDVSSLSSGVYILIVKDKKKTTIESGKIVKQ